MKEILKPCDCKDIATTGKLNELGIKHNDQSIMVIPNVVVMRIGHTIIHIPQKTFKMFAEWYLEGQVIGEIDDKTYE